MITSLLILLLHFDAVLVRFITKIQGKTVNRNQKNRICMPKFNCNY